MTQKQDKSPGLRETSLARLPSVWKILLVLAAILVFYGAVFLATARAASLTIACYKDYRPYSYINNKGEVVGVLIDLWNIWGKKNNIALTYVPDHLSKGLERVKSGEADMMIGLFRSRDREKYLDFSTGILDVQTNLYVSEDVKINDISELGDTPVGVIEKDYVNEFMARQYPEVALKTFPGSEEVVGNALKGKIDAYALDFPNAIFLLAETDSLTRFRLLKSLYTKKLRAGVAKGNTEILHMVNQGIKDISKEEVDEIRSRWGISPEPLILEYRGWFITALLFLLAGVIGFFFYVRKLKFRMRQLSMGNRPFKKEEWLALIDQGESDGVEFKSTMRWNIASGKVDKRIEAVIVKTLSAFMNARGGTLFVGVNDEGELVGIEADYKTFQKKPNRDGFMLKLSSLISQNMGRHCHKFISTDIQTMEGVDVCRMTIRPGEKPVFVKEKGVESFYIRAGAASVPLSMSESHEYISSRW